MDWYTLRRKTQVSRATTIDREQRSVPHLKQVFTFAADLGHVVWEWQWLLWAEVVALQSDVRRPVLLRWQANHSKGIIIIIIIIIIIEDQEQSWHWG